MQEIAPGIHHWTTFRQTIRLNPKHPNAHYNRGNVLKRQNKLAEAAAAYREVIRHQPGYAEAHCNLGFVLYHQAQFVDALAAYRRGDGFEKRRLLAEEWAKYCAEAPPGPADTEGEQKVVPLRQRRPKAA